jgi:hypothetical protein
VPTHRSAFLPTLFAANHSTERTTKHATIYAADGTTFLSPYRTAIVTAFDAAHNTTNLPPVLPANRSAFYATDWTT